MINKQYLYIAIATFITVFIWVVSDIIHSQQKIQIPPETQSLMEPINPIFDQEAIKALGLP